jgi:hypothetical protein
MVSCRNIFRLVHELLDHDLDNVGGAAPTYCAFGISPEGEDLTQTLPCKGRGLLLLGIQMRTGPEHRTYGTGPGALVKGPPVLLARHCQFSQAEIGRKHPPFA